MPKPKFRVWCDYDKVMLSDIALINGLTYSVSGRSATFAGQGNARILMQFTGLHDKNGAEIYEGDILHVPYNEIGDVEVKFKDGQYNIIGYNLSKCCVTGNIYEEAKNAETTTTNS